MGWMRDVGRKGTYWKSVGLISTHWGWRWVETTLFKIWVHHFVEWRWMLVMRWWWVVEMMMMGWIRRLIHKTERESVSTCPQTHSTKSHWNEWMFSKLWGMKMNLRMIFVSKLRWRRKIVEITSLFYFLSLNTEESMCFLICFY
jgi:hypothetical protein